MLESRALDLLLTFSDEVFTKIDPLDFTALLYLSERGYVNIDTSSGKSAQRGLLQGGSSVADALVVIMRHLAASVCAD